VNGFKPLKEGRKKIKSYFPNHRQGIFPIRKRRTRGFVGAYPINIADEKSV
jgi:hypothetical protein